MAAASEDNATSNSAPESPLESPLTPSPLSSPSDSPSVDDTSSSSQQSPFALHMSRSATAMSPSSNPLGAVNAARHPTTQPTMSSRTATLPPEIGARMKAFTLGRQGTPPIAGVRPGQQNTPHFTPTSPGPSLGPGGVPSSFRPPPNMQRPPLTSPVSSPAGARAPQPSLAQKRGMALPGGLPGARTGPPPQGQKKRPGLTLSQMGAGTSDAQNQKPESQNAKQGGSLLDKYADYIDSKSGTLKFKGKAVLTNNGIEFSSGHTFSISLDEVDTLDELGKGNYGTVYKVKHSRPRLRKPGQGLAGNKANSMFSNSSTPTPIPTPTGSQFPCPLPDGSPSSIKGADGTSGVVMAMKEIRLELEDAKFAAIIMELDILHRCASPYIVDFYGAFFQEGAVYICMEFMDGGSIDKLYGGGIPESVLRKITLATTMGLKSLKDEHNIIHRDVKPTNILVNTRGQIKICDFGVSGNLVASIAKTNIGCQSYMAPERISSGGVAQAGADPSGGTYSVQSDIWSLGLTIIECGLGQYPYPPETYDNIFSQLSAIVDGEPPDLPADRFSEAACDFVRGCLMKIPKLRPTYAMLLQHAWLAPLAKPETITEEDEESIAAQENAERHDTPLLDNNLTLSSSTEDPEVRDWVLGALERRKNGTMVKKATPALHAAPLDVVSSPKAATTVA